MNIAWANAKQAICPTKLPYAPMKSPANENNIANSIGQETRNIPAAVSVSNGPMIRYFTMALGRNVLKSPAGKKYKTASAAYISTVMVICLLSLISSMAVFSEFMSQS